MGFMSGFGSAFAQSYAAGKERKARREDDMFNLMYQDTIRRRDKYEEWKRDDSKKVKAAKTLAEAYGQPEESWTKIYEMQEAGLDVEEYLKNGSFFSVERPDPADSPQLQEQMKDSGMAGPAKPATPAETAQVGDPVEAQAQGQTIGSRIFDTPDKQKARVEGRVMEATGMSPEEFKSINSGTNYEPPPISSGDMKIVFNRKDKETSSVPKDLGDALAKLGMAQMSGDPKAIAEAEVYVSAQRLALEMTVEANAKAKDAAERGVNTSVRAKILDENGLVVDTAPVVQRNGKYYNKITGKEITGTVEMMSPQENKAWGEIVTKFSKEANDYQMRVNRLGQFAKLNSEMVSLIDPTQGGDPGVISRAGVLSQWVSSWKRDIEQVGYLTGIADIEAREKALEAALSSGSITDRIQAQAIKRELFEAKAIKMAYLQASAHNESGQISNKDLDTFLAPLLNTSDPRSFIYGNMQFLLNEKSGLQDLANSMNNYNSSVLNFKDEYGYIPGPLMPDVNEVLGENAKLFDENMKLNPEGVIRNDGKPDEKDVPTPMTQEEFDALPDGAYFKKPGETGIWRK